MEILQKSNMIMLPILLLVIKLNFLNSAAIPNTESSEFYSALELKCPSLKDFHDFRTQNVFTICNNLKEIEQVTSLTKETEQSVRCLLYFDSLVYFCHQLDIQNVSSSPSLIGYFTPELKDYTVEKICKNLTLFHAKEIFKHSILKSISNEQHCIKLCDSYTNIPERECSLAHYFANFNVTELKNSITQNFVPKETKLAKVDAGESSIVSKVESKSIGNVDTLKSGTNLVVSEISLEKAQAKADSEGAEAEKTSKGAQVQTVQTSPKEAQAETDLKETHLETGEKISVAESGLKNTQAETISNGGDTKVDKDNSQGTLSENNASVGNHNPLKVEQAQEDPQTKQDKVEEPKQNESEAKPSTKNSVVQTTEAKGKTTLEEEEDQALSPDKDIEKDVANKETNSKEVNANKGPAAETDNDLTNNEDDMSQEEADIQSEDQNDEDKGDLPVVEDNMKKPEAENQKPEVQDQKPNKMPEIEKNDAPQQQPVNDNTLDTIDGESYFFSYFMVICVLFVLGYVGYHNRQKVIALVLEGKQGKRRYRGRRPNSANYHKLDSNLEEAISSSCTKSTSHIIY